MVRIIIFCLCFGFSIISVLFVVIGSFTPNWWISKEVGNHLKAGLRRQCTNGVCINYDVLFETSDVRNRSHSIYLKETLQSSKEQITELQVFMLVCCICLCTSLLGIATLIYFVSRCNSVKIAWWFRLLVLLQCSIGGLMGLIAVYFGANPPVILRGKITYGYSWFFVLVGSSISVIIGICLLAAFYCRNICPRHVSTDENIDENLSNTVTRRTPHHNHPYMQYYADENEPKAFDNDILEGSYSMAQLDTFSNEPYAELAFEIPMTNSHLSCSYTNLTRPNHGERNYDRIEK